MSLLKKITLFSFLVFTAFNPKAQAEIEIEPYIGYLGLKTSKSVTVSGNTTKKEDTYGALGYGGKLGWAIANVAFSGDIMMFSHGNEKSINYGPAVAVDLLLVTLKATYFISSSIKDGNSTATGTGIKGGIGFSIFPFVQFNLEYIGLTLNKMKDSDLGSLITNYDEKVNGVFGSLSLVF